MALFRWVFKQLYDKGLVYRGVKVMPFSTACNTPLSNFESHQNYKVGAKRRSRGDAQIATAASLPLDVCPPGRSRSIRHCQLPIGGEWGRGPDCLDHHTLDTAQQPGPLCQPRDVVCEGQR